MSRNVGGEIGRGGVRGRDAASPGAIPHKGWWAILRRVWRALGRDHIWLASAGVAFCGVFATVLGAAALAALSALVVSPDLARRMLEGSGELLPRQTGDFLAQQVQAFAEISRVRLGTGLGGALLAALWSARGAATALIGACNIAYREQERRGFWRYQAVALTTAMLVGLYGLAALSLLALPTWSTNHVVPQAPWREVALLARWPLLAVLTMGALAAVYRLTPCRARPRWRWVLPGASAATVLWLAGSAVFTAYVTRFPSYNAILGSLGSVLLLLSWFYLAAFVVLLGAELNAEIERQTARDTTEGPERPMGQRGARTADMTAADEEERVRPLETRQHGHADDRRHATPDG